MGIKGFQNVWQRQWVPAFISSFYCAECYVCDYFKPTYPLIPHTDHKDQFLQLKGNTGSHVIILIKAPKQEIKEQEILICFPENKELGATETKHQVVFIGNVQISHGNQHIFKARSEWQLCGSRAWIRCHCNLCQPTF